MTDGRSSWVCDREKTLLESPVMSLVQRDCRSSDDGREHRFYVMRSRDWCNIIPVTEDGKVVLVRQFRIGVDLHTLEAPGGVAETGEDVQATALREMAEETGYEPAPGARCVSLGWTHPNPAILDNRNHFFVVGPVRRAGAQKLDAGEMIDVVEVPIGELAARIARGEFTHALHVLPLLLVALRAPETGRALARELEAFTRPEPAPATGRA